nr:hypothetical protein [uncultured Methanospirillum sp.]
MTDRGADHKPTATHLGCNETDDEVNQNTQKIVLNRHIHEHSHGGRPHSHEHDDDEDDDHE